MWIKTCYKSILQRCCNHSTKVLLLAASLVVLSITYGANVRCTSSDPRGSLLTSQAIANHFTIKLDNYKDSLPDFTYKVYKKGEHFYYAFPIGTSLFVTPVVYASNLLGLNMEVYKDDALMQIFISGLIGAGTLILFFRIAGLYLTPVLSIISANLFWCGSSFASTGATALWSHNMATFFALFAIYLSLSRNGSQGFGKAILIGLFLFSAYLCRPTLSLLSMVLIIFIWQYSKRLSLIAAATVLCCLGLFILFSWIEFHQLLPDYYLPKRLDGGYFWIALYGNLLSPARGLFVYSPFLLIIVCALPWVWWKQPQNRSCFWLLLWPVLHLIAISKFPHWWAGYSYGPRLMFDVLPAFFVYFVLVISQFASEKNFIQISMLSCAIFFAVLVNTGQGLFNVTTAIWNADPSVDEYPEYLFDWRYPQFLHTKNRHARRIREHNAAILRIKDFVDSVSSDQTDLKH